MDSGNSTGSLQSSSSAEGECDSRSAVNNDSTLITNHHQQQQQQSPPLINHHMMMQIDHHQNDQMINNPFLFSSSQQHQLLNPDSILWSQTLQLSSSDQPAAVHTVPFSEVSTAITPSTNPPLTATRNPKKRSRASRRAPTTVLTTNTANFRAMVQEFTGIPAPPFTSPLAPTIATTSFDLFGRPSTVMRSNMITNFDNLPQQPSYLLPQKLQSSSSSNSSFLDSSCYQLPNTMQMSITFPSNSLDQSQFLNPKTTANQFVTNRFGGIRQTQMKDHHTATLQDLVTFQQTPQSPPEK